MSNCRWFDRVERWFDGAARDAEAVERHMDECPACRKHAARLEVLRQGVRAVARREEIGDAQLPAFVAGIRANLERPEPRRGLWALASVAAAALVVAVSLFVVFSGGPQPVDATVVESCYTELEGATVSSSYSEDGVATVWVNVAQDDML